VVALCLPQEPHYFSGGSSQYFDNNMANQITEEGKKILREYLKKFQDILN
jgi:hypothetical protein